MITYTFPLPKDCSSLSYPMLFVGITICNFCDVLQTHNRLPRMKNIPLKRATLSWDDLRETFPCEKCHRPHTIICCIICAPLSLRPKAEFPLVTTRSSPQVDVIVFSFNPTSVLRTKTTWLAALSMGAEALITSWAYFGFSLLYATSRQLKYFYLPIKVSARANPSLSFRVFWIDLPFRNRFTFAV